MTKTFKLYLSIKKKYPRAILLFRVGDDYTAINDDAIMVAKHTSIPLEEENNNRDAKVVAKVPLAYTNNVMQKLIKVGYKVALCDPLESPGEGKVIPIEL